MKNIFQLLLEVEQAVLPTPHGIDFAATLKSISTLELSGLRVPVC